MAWWLIAAASGAQRLCDRLVHELVRRPHHPVRLHLKALVHHMLGGIRRLIWDTGRGFGPQERGGSGVATLVGSIAWTIIIWVVGYLFMGGPR